MAAYYNEHDPFAAAWLRELIKAGLIADGEVDERDIQDVGASDVRGFTQCHFFAGIGGWSHALRLAGWPDDRPVWTGSCPCQGYSAAGKQEGAADARNLWPSWFRLIRECEPLTIFGEQVANATGHGWLDAVSTDVEGINYAIGAVVLGAHSVGAPHRRQRLWFVADTQRGTAERSGLDVGSETRTPEGAAQERERLWDDVGYGGNAGDMGDTNLPRSQGRISGELPERARERTPWAASDVSQLADDRLQGCGQIGADAGRCGERSDSQRLDERSLHGSTWIDAEWIRCRDGKSRPTQSGLFPLAHGVSGRVGRLRGYGNAIVPQVAAEVIGAFMELG